ncbi:hypothetical protein [Nostoc sp. PCC 7524]|uniref:hypothetical protein n=1 Tax=Nostoc sp. (strain ATCC 29411 / PCC 7524) TaxID=28072 RepID=UPI001181B4B0|nr:hypothetical protein [Nostoc sp. PCC 7524]
MSYHPPDMILQLLDTPNRTFPCPRAIAKSLQNIGHKKPSTRVFSASLVALSPAGLTAWLAS